MLADIAVGATPEDHPNRAIYLFGLGSSLDTRSERIRSLDNLNRALSYYKEGWACSSSALSIRIQFTGLASAAAATALSAGKTPYQALRLLELGRDVIAGLLMEMRRDIRYPHLADKFTNLLSKESRVKRRHEASQSFEKLIDKIRAQPKFHNFLLPPTADEMMEAANPGPIIVINVSPYRCDSFLIERDQIRALQLAGLNPKDAQVRAHELRSSHQASFHISQLLEWLWDVVSLPSLEALGFTKPLKNDWPRVWWIPTGLLSHLPLHAAGHHIEGSSETVLDRVMSSYSSSVKALIHTRRGYGQRPMLPQSENAVLVAMRETPGLSVNRTLPFAADEVDMLNAICPSMGLKPITPSPRKDDVSPSLCRDDVLKHLRQCRIFHFAGHGRPDPTEPSRSCLLLEDWESKPLTAGDLRDHNLWKNPPFLAYLSACSTGANEADELVDEGVHLVSAFQLAGFCHVVGTLWKVSDRHCVNAARVLYETIRDDGMTDAAVCRGLHRAIRALRDEQIKGGGKKRDAKLPGLGTEATQWTSAYWVPYIHFGV
ncbi:hypothetical protein TESG_08196 [Trichophyton tonsurans CBS 112818]|uniref:CHAT domain-containing protein n=1 Tax=Trichophyton tonsurans (strain CBS 112818) TaxID=647933 RepID=F2SBF2_TRIT1|nr:hypothetical protein TESG_08196 [Trichophyton tonsurans CBS 112818]